MTIYGATPVTLVDASGNNYSAGTPGVGSTVIAGASPVVLVDQNGNTYTASPWTTVPATATSTGTTGQLAEDGTYLYVCTATNTWKRTALTTF